MTQDDLEAFIDKSIHESHNRGYRPTTFEGMRRQYGTVLAIKKLVESGEIQSGFKRMQSLELLPWSIEAAVVKFPSSFTADTLECANFRLRIAEEEARKTKK